MQLNHDLQKLIEKLPIFIQKKLETHSYKDQLLEIVLDLGCRPEARFILKSEYLSQKNISWQDLDSITKQINKFSDENRAGIERTLHRISCIRNRQFLINGLTCRVGRSVFGLISIIRDLLEFEKSILILGKPGVGKTTIIREISRVLADELKKRVIIIDTSNEIAGDSDLAHLGIGNARRMQVQKTNLQHQIMIEAVENHMPQVIIIDEIGTDLEALAARTIAEKGVQLVGTIHGNCLENLIKNPILSDLIGGIQYVTLSDNEANRRKTQKSILERKAYPTFEIIIELNEVNFWTIYENVENSIDLLLRQNLLLGQVRQFFFDEKVQIKCKKYQNIFSRFNLNKLNSWKQSNFLRYKNFTKLVPIGSRMLVIYPYSISYNVLHEVFLKTTIKYDITNNLRNASLILGLHNSLQQNFQLKQLAKYQGIPIYSFKKLSIYQLNKFIHNFNSEMFIH